ncbi:hypothetical protein STCU_09742 [Strigomonas culicis]|uniref:Uncharacterized protein n=1 Tax=Strigomonas culicis TaxID=28005 RepID=S9UWD8_9TRYP|nr:hypothetical protein STCU_09742 [Strigomonas culicis]|eukprot:EPY18856.1 hypothetical protein STCU_09742 [Strigomonas culicis]
MASVQKRVNLSAGEECTISGTGTVHIRLLAGVLEVAGVPLEATETYDFPLQLDARALLLYTLEGGSFSVGSEAPVEVHRAATGAAVLAQLARRTLAPRTACSVLVIGDRRGGRTHAAHTLYNLLRRLRPDEVLSSVALLDMNAESNCLYTPGCVSALVTNEAELPLWLGRTNAPQQVTLNFPVGGAQQPSTANVATYLHALEQLYDTAVAYAGERLPQRAAHRHVVVDAPAPEGELQPGVFYKRLLELVRPSHVVLVAARDAAHETVPGQGSWTSYLQEDVQRLLPDCEFVFVPPQARPCPQSTRPLLLLEYFVGTPLAPLGCSKVVVPLSGAGLQCCSLTATVGADGTVAVQRVQPDRSWRGLVCRPLPRGDAGGGAAGARRRAVRRHRRGRGQ